MMNSKRKLPMFLLTGAMLVTIGIGQHSVLAAGNEIEREFSFTTQAAAQVESGFEIDVSKPNPLNTVTEEIVEPEEATTDEQPIVSSSTVATPPAKARGTVTSSVGADNKEYPVRTEIGDKRSQENGQLKERPKADAREFLTFKTKSGKVFYLIIDRQEKSDNVMLVTEVSEQDLLNMIDETNKNKPAKVEPKPVQKPEVVKEEPEKEEAKQDSGIFSWVVLGIIGLAVGGVGYYFKVIKVKKEKDDFSDFEEDEIDDEYIDEDSEDEDISASNKEELL